MKYFHSGNYKCKERMLIKSMRFSWKITALRFWSRFFSLPVYFENDANAAMMAENAETHTKMHCICLK